MNFSTIRTMFAPDTGLAGVDPEVPPFDDGFQIEDVPDEPSAGPSAEEIQKQLADLKAQNAELAARASQNELLKTSFDRFGSQLEQVARPTQAPQVAQQPGETVEQFKQRINERILENPYETLMEFTNRAVGGAFQTVAEQMLAQQRKLAYLETDDKDFFTRHQKEIDEEVQRTPVEQRVRDPEIYRRAVDLVKARNMNEIIAAEVAKAVAAAGMQKAAPASAPVGLSDTPAATLAPSSTPAALSAASATGGPRRVQMTPAKRARIERQMMIDNVPQMPFNLYVESLIEEGRFDKI